MVHAANNGAMVCGTCGEKKSHPSTSAIIYHVIVVPSDSAVLSTESENSRSPQIGNTVAVFIAAGNLGTGRPCKSQRHALGSRSDLMAVRLDCDYGYDLERDYQIPTSVLVCPNVDRGERVNKPSNRIVFMLSCFALRVAFPFCSAQFTVSCG